MPNWNMRRLHIASLRRDARNLRGDAIALNVRADDLENIAAYLETEDDCCGGEPRGKCDVCGCHEGGNACRRHYDVVQLKRRERECPGPYRDLHESDAVCKHGKTTSHPLNDPPLPPGHPDYHDPNKPQSFNEVCRVAVLQDSHCILKKGHEAHGLNHRDHDGCEKCIRCGHDKLWCDCGKDPALQLCACGHTIARHDMRGCGLCDCPKDGRCTFKLGEAWNQRCLLWEHDAKTPHRIPCDNVFAHGPHKESGPHWEIDCAGRTYDAT
jgi:hypothetical protein